MAETKKDKWAELRKPFEPKQIGKLPRAGRNLDYVGHAIVTDRLLAVDPTWTWEPMGIDEQGRPVVFETKDNFGKPRKGMWIRLTVNGVTRPGFGDGATEKECIGDALRNAAMRFGVALDLWSKEELAHEETIDPPAYEEPSREINDDDDQTANPIRDKELITRARTLMKEQGLTKDKAEAFIQITIDKSRPETKGDYKKLIDMLEAQKEAKEPF